ncbi:DUF6030 family protein [uncultured Thiocystis sp.]|jgi:hypothetical protein|uniref:DUF6030 family protein n=1 Tax=uncultured Thiocystis sp. TaxID=1202134 RepID=UPI0025D284C9|nr:DUF6030 family protein [uncultured Thiocystis sp.]
MRFIFAAFLLAGAAGPANATFLSTDPSTVCSYLTNSGLATRGWKNQYDNEFGCSSPYKDIGTGAPLANNLAFYVEGGPSEAKLVKLVLNINNKALAASAYAELLKAAQALSPKLTGKKLPSEISSAITNGKKASANAGVTQIEVMRIDWPTGKGHEVKVFFQE